MVLVIILLMLVKLKIVMLRKPARFRKILHYVMISKYDVFVKNLIGHFFYDVNISL